MNIEQVEAQLAGKVNYTLLYETSTPGVFQLEAYGKVDKIVLKLANAGFPNAQGVNDYMGDSPYALVQFEAVKLTDWFFILAALATLGDDPQVWQRVESKISKTPVSPALVRVKLMTEAIRLADLPEPLPPQPVNNISGWTPRVKGMGRREWQGWKRSNGIK